jgi:hypothetical protein
MELECITHYFRKTAVTKELKAAMTYLYASPPLPSSSPSPSPVEEEINKIERKILVVSPIMQTTNHSRTSSNSSLSDASSKPDKTTTRPIESRTNSSAPVVKIKGETWGDWFKRKVGKKNIPNFDRNRIVK